jgi:ATP adenylyltransferase
VSVKIEYPSNLLSLVKQRTAEARKCGALQPIATEFCVIEDNNIPFVVRILANLERKEKAKKEETKKSLSLGRDFNPFLPYEQDLFVADISETHVCILNKFNVVEDHLLIITRDFEEQESLLTPEDFTALSSCLAGVEGLAFYNSGKIAGASQRHKHLQIVPVPLATTGTNIPLERLIAEATFNRGIGTIPNLPYRHGLCKFTIPISPANVDCSSELSACYRQLLQYLDLMENDGKYPRPYNFLATREWMLIVPRSAEVFESISINSLGFAGALLVKNQEQMEFLQSYGIMNVLKNVAYPIS